MVKPRQREYPTLKSSLNIVRETALIAISCVFWIYCLVVLLVYIGTIFEIHDESINTIRVALNIENTEILDIFETMGIFAIIIFVFFTISILIQKMAERKRIVKYRKLIILVLSILIILPVSTLDGHHIANADDDPPKKLKYKENSALALNYHRVRKANFLNNFIYFFSSSKEIKNYSVSQSQFESQIKWLKSHDAKFLTLKEFLYYKKKVSSQNEVYGLTLMIWMKLFMKMLIQS